MSCAVRSLDCEHAVDDVQANRRLWFYTLDGGELLDTIAPVHMGNMTSLSWSCDSKYLATSGEDNVAHIWNAPLST
jgi:WD40 repeat protein